MKIVKPVRVVSFGLIAGMMIPNPLENISYSFSDVKNNYYTDYNEVSNEIEATSDSVEVESSDYVYLSDIPYISSGNLKSSVGWKTITMDKTTDGTALQLKVEGSTVTFEKGVFAHAKSTVYYDLSAYNDTYAYFTTYYGVSAQRGSSGSVKFYIYTSVDGTNWTLETESNPASMNGNSAAKFVKIDIRGKKYLKLYADPISDNGQDHSLYADAKFVKEGYSDNVTKSVEEYDALIKEKYASKEIDDELELLLLQRNLVKKVGQYTLKTFINKSDANKETFNWLMSNREILKLYTVGGKPDGSYSQALQVLSNLYTTYKDDLSDETVFTNTFASVKAKDLYLNMMLALSLTHSTRVGLWVDSSTNSDALVRYEIYKNLHLAGKLNNDIFENLTVEEMRWVMNNIIDDEEIEWLNDLMKKRGLNDGHGAYQFITYTSGYNYNLDKYYSAENYSKWDTKYDLSSHNITYAKGHPRLWIVFEEGSVCGGLAKTWSNMRAVRGIPSSVVGQPGHAAAITYAITADGRGYWNLVNDVSGWSNSGRTEKIGVRMPNEWGEYNIATYTATLKPDSYVFLAQEAQNEYDKYEASEIVLLLEDVYKNDEEALEEIYWAALKEEKINFDALYGLTMLYKNSKTKTDEEKAHLAEVIIDTYTYHPLPMYDLIRNLLPTISSAGYKAKVVMLQEAALKKASKATSSNSLHSGGVKAVANNILGITDGEIASFSFNGTNKDKIILSDRFSGSEVAWDYSLDGGNTWIQSTEKTVTLTDEQLSSITAENDIKVHIIGVDYSEDNIFTINITKASLPTNLYRNDLENRLINATNTMEWRVKGTDEWTPIGDNSYRFNDVPEGSDYVEIEFRVFANGTCLASDIVTHKFWRDNQPRSRTYIPISHLSVARVSSEATANNGHAKHAIDGDYNTIWHSNYSGGDTDKFIDIKLDETKYISGLDYYPRQTGTNGRVNHGKMYVSMDGSTWTEVADFYWGNNASLKTITLDDSYEANYVRFKAITNYGDGRNFISAMAINLYEDLDGDRPRATVEYSTTENTTEAVTAIVKVNKAVTITDSAGNDYTQNVDGDFEFVVDSNKTFKVSFVDENGKTGTIDVTVNCIVDYDFSFNNDGSAVISIGEKYMTDEGEIEWKYSLDGGNSWVSIANNLTVSLSDEEIETMTESNGLQLSINLIKYNPEANSDGSFNTNTDGTIGVSVAVVNGANIPNNTLYANDLENKIFGTTTEMEWRYVEFDDTGLEVDNDNSYTSIDGVTITSSTKWTRFTEDTPKFKGEKKVQVRYAAYDNVLPGDEKTYRFTNVEQDEKHTYIPISNYKVYDYSSETNRTGNYEIVGHAIDGNKYTMWHTSRISTTDEKYISIELDKPRYITKVEAIGKDNYEFGNIKDGSVYVSMDGINWEKVAECHDDKLSSVEESRTHTKKTFEFAAVYAKYVKVQNDVSHDYVGSFTNSNVPADANWFLNLTMLNIYEDTNQVQEDTIVMVEYNVQGITNRDVIARVYSPNGTIRVTNNENSDTYVFEQNGSFEFEYEVLNANGTVKETGSITAVVGPNEETNEGPNIDKEVPVAELVYSETNKTKDSVTVSLIFNEQIIMLSDDIEFEKDYLGNYMLLFTENGTVNVKVKDLAGNITTIPITVSNIDKTAPIATVTYEPKELTNGQVKVLLDFDEKVGSIVSDLEFIKNNEEGTSYYVMVNQNINHTIEFTDEVGNKGSVNIFINWIDKIVPTASVIYSEDNSTYNPVIATFKTTKKVTYIGEDINLVKVDDYTYTYKFVTNGTFVFEYKDEAGNKGSTAATVSWINNSAEELEISYDISTKTNQDVTATIQLKDGYQVTNNGGSTTHTFITNDDFVFEYEDSMGRKGSVTAIVSWIDKDVPTAEISYSTKDYTNGSVIAKLVNASEEITIINNDGSDTYTFANNGEFTFEFVDKAGNVGTVVADVSWIKVAPDVSLEYSSLTKTGKDVDVTLVSNDGREIKIKNNNGSNIYTFTSNGDFTFEYEDMYGDTYTIEAVVSWIDKTVPTADVKYDKETLTNQDVTVTLVLKDGCTITNNDGLDTYTFTENGSFVFEFENELGIKGTETALVSWIDKEVPTAEVEYSTKEHTINPVSVTLISSEDIEVLNNDGLKTHIFTSNGTFTFEYRDKAGNIGSTKVIVDWIDEKAKDLIVTYDILDVTNKEVVSTLELEEGYQVTNNGGSNIYTFNNNGFFTFEYEDSEGRKGVATAYVSWIDKEAPVGTIVYDVTEETTGNVKAILNANEEITITNNGGSNTYIFTNNGIFTFEFVDKAGNKGFVTAEVSWILEHAEVLDVSYDILSKTNEDVTVTLILKDGYQVTNNGGLNTYTFTKNGEFKFTYVDGNGRTGETTAIVSWIDKTAPIGTITYSTKEYTYEPVVVKLTADEDIIILNNNGSDTYTFTKNGEFTFEYKDVAGNIVRTVVKVDWIKVATKVDIEYSSKVTTGEDVVVTLLADKDITILNNNGSDTYKFTENGEFTFTYRDEYGDEYSITAIVDWIDKNAPTAKLVYSTEDITNQDVIVTLIDPSRKITIINNDGNDTYTFKDNGTFTFIFKDELGNLGSETAIVNWIDKKPPTAELNFSTTQKTNKDVIVTLINPSEDITILDVPDGRYVFESNGTYIFRFIDRAGNEGTVTAHVDWIDKSIPTAEVVYDITNKTNKDVTVKLIPNEDVTILNNNGSDTYIFTENGEFTFEFENEIGNKGSVTAKVDWIKKTIDTLEVIYSTEHKTNHDVTATLVLKDGYKVINNDGSVNYTFNENDKFVFEYEDEYGNTNKVMAIVYWIDKTTPKVDLVYSTTDITEGEVIVSLINTNKKVIITNNNGSDTYIFTENGEFTFEFVDEYGNIGSAIAKVNWITKSVYPIVYSTQKFTNKDVVVTLDVGTDITILNNGGSNTYTFTENGTFTFEFRDKYGKIHNETITIDWINKEPIKASISYDTTHLTGKNVTAMLITDKEVTILNNSGSDTYVFTDNGEFTFEFVDKYGNEGSATAKVSWIKKSSTEDTDSVINPSETGNTGESTDNTQSVDNKPTTPDEPEENKTGDSSQTDKDVEENSDNIDYSLLKKIVIAVPTIGILYFLTVKVVKPYIAEGGNNKEVK